MYLQFRLVSSLSVFSSGTPDGMAIWNKGMTAHSKMTF